MKQFCPKCGTELKTVADFCPNCGYKLNTESKIESTATSEISQSAQKVSYSEHTAPKTQTFCPNCGAVLRPGAEFCTQCGYNLLTKKVPSAPVSPAKTTATRLNNATRSVQSHKPMSLKNKILFSTLGVVAVLLVGFYAWGSNYYGMNNQIDRITADLDNPTQDISKYITADSADVKATADNVKPLQNYYKDHRTDVTKLNSELKAGTGEPDLQLVKKGHYWLLFPKYQLQVKTYQPQVVTNHGDSTIAINGKNIGKLTKGSNKYYKKLSLVFPGKYHVSVKSKVAGRNLSATSTANIWDNKTLDMDIATQTFSVKSVPKGTVYINDKKVGALDSNGEATFKAYPITKNMQLYVVFNNHGSNIQSEPVTDMATSFNAFDDGSYGDDNNDYYNDDASDSSSDDVTKTNSGYIVEPKWKGVISTSDAEDLLNNAFRNVTDDDFVDGSANKGYNDIKSMEHSWDKSDAIDSYDTDASVESVYPASDNSCNVTYKITYTFHNDDESTKKQVVYYTGAIIQKSGDDQKIKFIGDGKVISSKVYDSDND